MGELAQVVGGLGRDGADGFDRLGQLAVTGALACHLGHDLNRDQPLLRAVMEILSQLAAHDVAGHQDPGAGDGQLAQRVLQSGVEASIREGERGDRAGATASDQSGEEGVGFATDSICPTNGITLS